MKTKGKENERTKKYLLRILPIFSGVLMGAVISYFLPAALQWISMTPFLAVLFSSFERIADAENESGSGSKSFGECISESVGDKEDKENKEKEREIEENKKRGKNIKSIFRFWKCGFLYFYPYYLFVWYWFLTMYPLEFTGMSKPAAAAAILAAWLGLPFIQAFVASWQVPVFMLTARSRIFSGKALRRIMMPLIYAFVYVFFEWTEILTWAGVPWGRLAVAQAYDSVFVESAALFGSYFVTFVIVLVNGYATLSLMMLISPKGNEKLKRSAFFASLSLVVFLFNLTLGTFVNAFRTPDSESGRISIGIVQGNVSSTDKWRDGSFDNLYGIYSRLTEKAANEGADIVLWSETSFPYVMNEYFYIKNAVSQMAYENDVILLATSFWREDDGIMYNSVMTVDSDGNIDEEGLYHKQRLVPFGEFIPYEDIIKIVFPPLSELSMFGNSVGSGNGRSVQETDAGKAGTLVCFDSIYEEYAMNAVKDGAEFITVSTNDSWFGTSAALYQHTAQGILRAIETDRYVVRSANTGYSCAISPSGKIIAELPVGEEGEYTVDIFRRNTRTLYSVIGNAFVFVSALATAVVLADGTVGGKIRARNIRKNKN